MASPNVPSVDTQQLISLVHSLKVRDLVAICGFQGLGKTGVKAEIQNRIINAINQARASNDASDLHTLYSNIARVVDSLRPSNNTHQYSVPHQNGTHTTHNFASGDLGMSGFGGYATAMYSAPNNRHGQPRPHLGLEYKPSPFYRIKSVLGNVHTCEVMAHHRNNIVIPLKVNDMTDLYDCASDSSNRVMLLCAGGNTGPQDIAFPHQCELKVNGGDVKANLRGLKNKPGSTRPVDITDLLRLRPPTYQNTVDFTYALTSKKFYVAVYLCEVFKISSLVQKIQDSPKISRASVIQEIVRKANADPDIVATSTTLSLKCPLSGGRISLPVRSLSCKHIQCFDARSYLQLQEQGPQWICPECNKPAIYDNLAVDEYMKDILTRTSASVEAVTVEPDGKWRHMDGAKDEEVQQEPEPSFVVDDDDLPIISGVQVLEGKSSTPDRNGLKSSTPNTGRREGSTASGPTPSRKRQVIDLTLDSDDEDGQPPQKRPNISGFSNDPSSFGRGGW